MAVTLYHLNPKTERIGRCAVQKGVCPFGSDNPHFATKGDTQAYYENNLESEYGLFGDGSKSMSMKKDAVAKRLNLLPDSAMEELIKERFKRGGYTPKEVTNALNSKEPFYVYYTSNQEMTLDPDDSVTSHTFMKGACSYMAAELHKATGWPIVIYSDSKAAADGYWQGHVVVKTPEGKYLDVSGVSDNPNRVFGALANNFESREVHSVEELNEHILKGSAYPPQKLEFLERFALSKVAYEVLSVEGLLED